MYSYIYTTMFMMLCEDDQPRPCTVSELSGAMQMKTAFSYLVVLQSFMC